MTFVGEFPECFARNIEYQAEGRAPDHIDHVIRVILAYQHIVMRTKLLPLARDRDPEVMQFLAYDDEKERLTTNDKIIRRCVAKYLLFNIAQQSFRMTKKQVITTLDLLVGDNFCGHALSY